MFLLETTVATNTNDAVNGAVQVANDVGKFLQSINWAAPTWDLFIVLFFIVTVFLYGMSLGRDRIIVILVSIYMALAVVSNAPFLGKMSQDGDVSRFFAVKLTS